MAKHTCPECGEPVVNRPPKRSGGWRLCHLDPARLHWSHEDGEPLCPVMTEDGYQPALPQ